MLSAYDVMNDFRQQYGWLVIDQLMYALDFIDSRGEGLALFEYLEEQVIEEEGARGHQG